MFHTIPEFRQAWQFESEKTLNLLRNLSDASLTQKVAPGGRTLGFIAWHITTSISEMASHASLPVNYGENDPVPATAAQIADTYESAAKAVAAAVEANWEAQDLPVEAPMYGQKMDPCPTADRPP